MVSYKVICPAHLQNHNIPAFSLCLSGGEHDLATLVSPSQFPDLIRFLLKYPTKNVPINPQDIADKKILSAEEVAGFGYEIVVGQDQKTGEPVLAEPDVEKAAEFEPPEGIPLDADFAKMSIAELKEWMDDTAHPVKYEAKWHKEQYVKACQRAAKKLRQ